MKRNIEVFARTDADYGLLHWLMKGIQAHSDLSLQVIVGATYWFPFYIGAPRSVIEHLERRIVNFPSSEMVADRA